VRKYMKTKTIELIFDFVKHGLGQIDEMLEKN